MVQDIRVLERALGRKQKAVLDCEKPCFAKLGKSVVTAKALEKGTPLLQIGIESAKIQNSFHLKDKYLVGMI